MKMDAKIDTKKQIMDIAENLLLDRGYNGFSYKDISSALNIKNAAIHYHFPKKTDLGVAIIGRVINGFQQWASYIDSQDWPYSKKLNEFCQIFKIFVEKNQVCLGGSLETDFETLPEEMQKELRRYISIVFQWLENFLAAGREKGEFNFPGSARDQTLLLVSSLQGIVQIVRVTTPANFDLTVKQIMRYVCA